MRAAGVETLVDVRELAIMGALEVASALPKFLRVFRQLRAAAKIRQPDAVILLDWPEFNLRLAKKLKRDGQRVFYYISPQVWAWRSYRVKAIKRDVERMLVILPFEKEFYEQYGIQVDYVGHPLLDSVHVTASREEFCRKYKLDTNKPIVAMLPGSRHKEVSYILPPMVEASLGGPPLRLHLDRVENKLVMVDWMQGDEPDNASSFAVNRRKRARRGASGIRELTGCLLAELPDATGDAEAIESL